MIPDLPNVLLVLGVTALVPSRPDFLKHALRAQPE
jgi:hypothetical protein